MLNLNLKNAYKNSLGVGITSENVSHLMPKLKEVKTRFLKEDIAFKKLPYEYSELKRDLHKVEKLAEGMNTIVVVGIGGSDLGSRAIHLALNGQYYNENKNTLRKIYFTGDTTDPEAIGELLNILDLKKTLFLIISKSGDTIEQSISFIYFRNKIIEDLGQSEVIKHFIFITDENSGMLREISKSHGFNTLNFQKNIGGRFSVLSNVGLVVAHLSGVNVEEILNGAKELDQDILYSQEDLVMKYVALQYLYYRNGKNISVIMPYQYSLQNFAKWYRQLWAESLGKKSQINGELVNYGITPISSLGPTDQHSQLQLYNDGPNDKFFTFIIGEESSYDIKLPSKLKELREYQYLEGESLHEILLKEMQTTAFTLTKNQRPNVSISVPILDEFYLGQLFYFFEVAVVYLGYLLNVNPFDQPGVEHSKRTLFGLLGREGFESEKNEFNNYLKQNDNTQF